MSDRGGPEEERSDRFAQGECRSLIENADWASTPLGPADRWSPVLRSWVATILASRQPMVLFWGPKLTLFYNDAFVPSFGVGKHPDAMGQEAEECWREAWPVIGSQIRRVMDSGDATIGEDMRTLNFRNGRLEEVYWTYSYSPVFEADGQVIATLAVCTETTNGVLARRRLSSIARLAEVVRTPDSPADALGRVLESLKQVPEDIPWAVQLDAELEVEAVLNVDASLAQTLRDVPVQHPSAEGSLCELEPAVAAEAWPDAATRVFAAPLDQHGWLLFGISPQLSFDGAYRDYLQQLAKATGNAMRRAQAQQQRSELIVKLESANRVKDEFFALLGHELRNPLAPIVTALEVLRLQSQGALPPQYAMIKRHVAHLVRLVDDLLDVARLTHGKVRLKKSNCDLCSIIEQAVEEVAPILAARGHRLDVDAQGPIPARADAGRLVQVVANLLTNAVRYTEPRGLIRVSARRDAEELVVEVSDTGRGLQADAVTSIFDVFVQGAQGSDRPEGGLGLGLALVKNLVELHGGTVEAQSPGLGRGSTFIVRLPGRMTPTTETPRVESARPHPTTILVVDDNPDAAEMLAMLLRIREHTVAVADDGHSALVEFERCRPAVVVLDIGLPGMDGYELLGELRNRSRALKHNFGAIALTGFGLESDRARSAACGFTAHLVKPVNLELLDAALAKCDPRQGRPDTTK